MVFHLERNEINMVFYLERNEINTEKIPAQTQQKDTRLFWQVPRTLLESVNP